jgi:type IV pilus assembly protein PilA
MKKMQQGFTLIELMIVVAIIGILAAIALPAYQNYIARSKVTEGVTALDAAKTSVTEYWTTNGSMPATQAAAGLSSVPTNAKYITALTYNTSGSVGSVVVTLGNINSTVNGAFIGVFGTGNSDGTVTWVCGTATAATATAPGAVTASYPFIPSNCRS